MFSFANLYCHEATFFLLARPLSSRLILMAEAVDATNANFLPQLVYANFGK
jgi:hypothetical protein